MSSRTKRVSALLAVGAGLMMAAPAQAEAQTPVLAPVDDALDNFTLPRLSLPPGAIPSITPSPPTNIIPKIPDPLAPLIPARSR